MISTITLLCLFGFCVADYMTDCYVDRCINTEYPHEIRDKKQNTIRLGNFEIAFKHKVAFVTSKVKCEYYDGILNGSSYVRRLMPSTGPSSINGALVSDVTLVFDRLDISYKMDGKYGKIPKVHNNDCKVKFNPINAVMKIKRIPGSNYTSVESLTVKPLRECNSKYSGLGPLNKVLKIMKEHDKDAINAQIQSAFTGPIRMALQSAFIKCPFPQANNQQFSQNQALPNPAQSPQNQGSWPNPGLSQYPPNQGPWQNSGQPQYPQNQAWQNPAQPQYPQNQAWQNPAQPQYPQNQAWQNPAQLQYPQNQAWKNPAQPYNPQSQLKNSQFS